MKLPSHRTKIVATIGPASSSIEVIRQLIQAGMAVARLNFSHGSYDDHAKTVKLLRQASDELDTPIALLQDLQGPKVRVGQLSDGAIALEDGAQLELVPLEHYTGQANTVPIDYPYLAEEAEVGSRILLDDGLLEFRIEAIAAPGVTCQVIRGGMLKSRKGVNLPNLDLRLPSLTDKDRQDLEFGLAQGVDWVALSFVRRAEDVKALRALLAEKGATNMPVLAKIEKPQAVAQFEAIASECDGIMVARGDLGVEVNPEKVPLIQKRLIRICNQRGIPVITATQMLESMIKNPRPTRAEASDVANAILDGTDAVMLSGESAVGDFPVRAVEMMARIAIEVESALEIPNLPPIEDDETHAMSEAINIVDKILNLQCIAAFTTTGYTARLVAAERPRAPIVAFTPNAAVYHRLNLIWGVTPFLLEQSVASVEDLVRQVEHGLKQRELATSGDRILVLGGSPIQAERGTNFLKIHRLD
ncbi:pyruvate kinase [Oscillatoria sp. FACHB-1407]|uniref:pyruvate kinase n=1 Tax=Oscillatoria sp. FACHB-1407 TaxID=2692847 RepID=UPI00168627BE|nr:pyruvate kinase [Oscillatoria sp. FACHB-1407]MBD2464180.1 pyruvate kinase [Oscillatoria sp. FACHB-1407]